jgi:hypothetical protein
VYDNSPGRFGNYFAETLTILPEKESALIDSSVTFNKLNQPFWIGQGSGTYYYKIGNPIVIKDVNSYVTSFPFPMSESYGRCNYDRPAFFSMQNTTISCYIGVGSQTCTTILGVSRINRIQSIASSPDLAKYITPEVTFVDASSGVIRNVNSLSSTCATGDFVTSVRIF